MLLSCFLTGKLIAQEYSDKEIKFNRAEFIEEIKEEPYEFANEQEFEKFVSEVREQHLAIYKQRLQNMSQRSELARIPILNTGCTNMDFSQQTDAWTYHWSNNNYNVRPSQDNGSSSQYGSIWTGLIQDNSGPRFQVLNALTNDTRLGQPVNPGATAADRVLRLGNPAEVPNSPTDPGQLPLYGQEEVSKSFTVTQQNSVLEYSYAIVFESPTHTFVPNSFDIFIEVNGQPLSGCSVINYTFNDATNANGFVPSAVNPEDRVKQWSTNRIDLLSHPSINLNDVVTISFRIRDCGFGGHGSYAYVSARCLTEEEAIDINTSSGDNCVGEPITFSSTAEIPNGATLEWEITQGTTQIASYNGSASIVHTFAQPGTYTVTLTLTPPDGCGFSYSIDVVVQECVTCDDCDTTGDAIASSVSPGLSCDAFFLTVPENAFECYDVIFNSGEAGSADVLLNTTPLFNNTYHFNYTSGGSYVGRLTLIDQATGKECFYRRVPIESTCCVDCGTVGTQIMKSITDTENCGEYQLTIPNGALDCYKVVFSSGEGGVSQVAIEASDLENGVYTFNYQDNGSYTAAVWLYDLDTGKECFFDKVGLVVDCFTNEECQENPQLEELLADHLVSMLNAIVDLDNGFTGNCVSGNSSTWINITTMPEVVAFMQAYDFETRLQNAVDIREETYNGNYPYYTVDIQNVYYKWGYQTNGHPPCLTIVFSNGDTASPEKFQYKITGGFANGSPISTGLYPAEIAAFTNIEIDVSAMKATYTYLGTDGASHSIYDILWPYTHVQGYGNALRFCWFHDLNYQPPSVFPQEEELTGLAESLNEDESKPAIEALEIYPNPSGTNEEVAFDGMSTSEVYSVQIRDVYGSVVRREQVVDKTIQLKGLQPGIYFLSFETKYGKVDKKLIIKH